MADVEITAGGGVRRGSRERSRRAGGANRALSGVRVLAGSTRGRSLGEAARFLARAAASPVGTLSFVSALHGLCEEAGSAVAPFDLLQKPTRPFLAKGLAAAERAFLLRDTYEALALRLPRPALAELLAGRDLPAATLAGRSGGPYRLVLSRSWRFRQEGELSLRLDAPDGEALGTLTLAFGSLEDAGRHLWIGGLQGATGPDSKARTVAATRDLSGLRPKDLLVSAAYALRDLLGRPEDGLRGVSNSAHVRAREGGRTWTADYDGYWSELGGVVDGTGRFFQLPAERRRRREEEVPGPKRRAWRARSALLDAVCTGVAGLSRI